MASEEYVEEHISEITVAMQSEMGLGKLASVIHPCCDEEFNSKLVIVPKGLMKSIGCVFYTQFRKLFPRVLWTSLAPSQTDKQQNSRACTKHICLLFSSRNFTKCSK